MSWKMWKIERLTIDIDVMIWREVVHQSDLEMGDIFRVSNRIAPGAAWTPWSNDDGETVMVSVNDSPIIICGQPVEFVNGFEGMRW